MKLLLVAALATVSVATADEGLWPYNQLPDKQHVPGNLQQAAVRIGNAGSGSFVSPQGLILTNRQLINGCLPNLQDAFVGEKPCPGLEAKVLLSIEDVTARVKIEKQSVTQRNANIAQIESGCSPCSVVELFSGGRYDLYRYKSYSDLRLIFAPEYSAAFFGKERDSITYLRYGLNIAFLRAYENGKPASTPHYLKWSTDGVKEGDVVFTAGNPQATSRVVTAAQLTFYRDTLLPIELARLQTRIAIANDPAMVNTFKVEAGKLIGLRDDRLVTRKTVFDQKIRRAVEADSRLGPTAAKVWDEIAVAYKKWKPLEKPYQILESAPAPGSKLFQAARQIVRGAPGTSVDWKADPKVETAMLTQYLAELKAIGEKGNHPTVEAMLQPDHQAILEFAKQLEPAAQKLRKQHEEIIGSLEVTATEKIAQYRFRLFGAAEPPDGTGTPRVSFGTVTGYTDRAAVAQPFASTFSGLFYRSGNDGPWQVSQKWIDARPSLHETIPLDFVSTCDIGGGDYGGPVVNPAGELVGVTFDGNLESLPNTFLYTSDQARAVHVDVRGIVEALDKVYKETKLLTELQAGHGETRTSARLDPQH